MTTPALRLAGALGLESLDSPAPLAFQDVLQRLYDARFQGSVTLNFTGGVARSVVINDPVQVPLDVPGKRHA